MPDFRALARAVIACHADAETLDALVAPGLGTRTLRVAPDEILVVGPAAMAADVLREVRDRVSALERDALVLDVSDGWSAWSLAGPDAPSAFSFLSPLEAPAPDGWIQGDVARVLAKVIGEADGSLTMLVTAFHSEQLRSRALADARATEVRS